MTKIAEDKPSQALPAEEEQNDGGFFLDFGGGGDAFGAVGALPADDQKQADDEPAKANILDKSLKQSANKGDGLLKRPRKTREDIEAEIKARLDKKAKKQ